MQVAIESGAIILAPKYDFLGWVPKQSHGRRLGYDGFFAFLLLQQKGWAGTAFGWKTARPFCCVQAPVGARVASPQSPILRWSKGSVSRFRYLGGL